VLVRDGVLTVNGAVYESNFADFDGDHACVPGWDELGESCPPPHARREYRKFGANPRNRDFGPVVVEEDHIFMMGDNRYNSEDSRYWGQLPVENIKGRAEIIYWSYESIFFFPRFERLLMLIDLPPGRAWQQHLVRIVVIGLIAGTVVYYRRRDRRKEATQEE
jgi:hypothetical protein